MSQTHVGRSFHITLEGKDVIDRKRRKEGLTLEKLAKRAYISIDTIKRIRKPPTKVYRSSIEAVTNALALQIKELDSETIDIFEPTNPHKICLEIKIDLAMEEVQEKINLLLEALKLDSQDENVEIKIVRAGSVILTIEGSQEGIGRLCHLFQAGQLREIAGFSVEDVRFPGINTISLSEWLENNFNAATQAGWRSLQEVFNPPQLGLASRNYYQRSKEISLGDLPLVLSVEINPQGEQEINITARLDIVGEGNLPENLQFIVLDESGDIIVSISAVSGNNYIEQILEECSPGEEFSIQVVWNEYTATEYFAI